MIADTEPLVSARPHVASTASHWLASRSCNHVRSHASVTERTSGRAETRDGPPPLPGGSQRLTGNTRVIGAPTHEVGADPEARGPDGVG
jgi:hypothetical protein